MGKNEGGNFVFFKIVKKCKCNSYCWVDMCIGNVSSIINGNSDVKFLDNIDFLLIEWGVC